MPVTPGGQIKPPGFKFLNEPGIVEIKVPSKIVPECPLKKISDYD